MDLTLSRLGETAYVLLTKVADATVLPGSVFWAPTLASALLIAAASLAWARMRRGRRVRLAVLRRALFPRRLLRSASSKADLGLFLFNTLPAGLLIGGMLVSTGMISGHVANMMGRAFGPSPAAATPAAVGQVVATVTLFLAYELAYWLDHYLSHRIPALWEFHKVHHTAQALTPLTVTRVHPVDTLVFLNILSVVIGLTGGTLHYLFGAAASPTLLFGANVFMTLFMFTTVHLQHTHVWISFTGALGRVLMSPAHHQIHHSENPAHFNRNLGSCLSLWDWVFGTLYVPARTRETLSFGAAVREGTAPAHSVTGTLVTPFLESLRRLREAAYAAFGRRRTRASRRSLRQNRVFSGSG